VSLLSPSNRSTVLDQFVSCLTWFERIASKPRSILELPVVISFCSMELLNLKSVSELMSLDS
jgi:hypothetical protein